MRTKRTKTTSDSSDGGAKPRRKSTITAYDRMVMLLSRRDHSAHELAAKLRKAEHSDEEIQEALDFARTRNWLPDDMTLAGREAARLARAGKSPFQIQIWLKKKGLPTRGFTKPEGAEDDTSEEDSAYKTASKAWGRLVRAAERDVEKEQAKNRTRGVEESLKLRVSRLLVTRGFSSSVARAVFTRLLSENPL